MAEMIYANDLKQALKDAGMLDYVKAEVVYKSAWGVPIVDAEEVVRCKDCKYSTPLTYYDKGVKGLFCNYRGSIGDWRYRTETDYCSRGERKEVGE